MIDREDVITRLSAIINNTPDEKELFFSKGIYDGFKATITSKRITNYNPVSGKNSSNTIYESKVVYGDREMQYNEFYVKEKILTQEQFNSLNEAVMNLGDVLDRFRIDVRNGHYCVGTHNDAVKSIDKSVALCARNLIAFLNNIGDPILDEIKDLEELYR